TELADGGKELPMMKLLTRFAKEFPPGTDFRERAYEIPLRGLSQRSSLRELLALATELGGSEHLGLLAHR
ncbi:hypothetical protein AB0K71_25685, partial [Streptomyces syringium]|uniref:hypothetical protein n=1 Tax=Streptomyces syringium TaxID=76729 RepID=UPI00341E611B